MDFEKKDFDSKQRFGIRKLTVGVCSVLLSTLLLTTVNNNQTVHAATENGQQETDSDQGANADRGLNIVKESTTSTSQAGSETDTNEKKDTTSSESAQVQTSGVESAQKSDENSTNVENSATDTKTGEQKITTDQSKDIDTIQKTEPSKSNSSSTNETTNEEKSTTTETESEQTNTNTLNVKNTAKTAVNALAESKVAAKAATTTNGGYDSATWGTLDLSNWTGQNTTFNGTTYYQLTGYTGDTTHIIVPNEEDFELAGKSTNGNQVAISKDLIGSWKTATSIAFSKTDDKKIKLVSTDLNSTFQDNTNLTNLDANSLDTSSVTSMNITFEGDSKLSSLTGISDWDVSNVTAMTSTFRSLNGLSSLTGLENWDVSKVTNMDHIFSQDNCSNVLDLSAISNWKTSSVQNLTAAFANNRFTNLHGLENWDVSKVTTMGSAFMNNGSLTDISAVANWKTSSLTDMNRIFNVNQALTSLHGLENWDTSKVTNFEAAFANEGSLVDASAIANWNTSNATNMRNLFANSGVQYLDFSKWDFSKVTRASDVVRNVRTVVYFGDNATITANNLNTLGFGKVTNPIILASGALYTLLSGSNTNTHTITINNSNGSQLTTISVPVVYDASSASNATEAINSYKEMVDNKIQDYATANNYALKFVSAPGSTDDLTGHNNHLINYAEAKYQVVTVPTDQKKDLQVQDKTVYKGSSLTAKDLVTNSADFPEGTTFEFADNTEPNLNQLGTYDVKIAATYPVTVNGQQYTAVSGPVTAKVTVTDQMQFNIIYWDDTENKEIVKFDIQNAGNDGYSNNLKFPAGVETGNYQSVSVSGVPTGVTIAGNYWNSLDNSSTDWTVPNYKWTAAAAPSLYGANIVIHLAHRTTETTEQQTRQVTVNYVKTKVNEDGTYTEDGNAFDSAVLDVYYTRTATTDKVTGKTTYGAWKWDTSKGDTNTPGYHVVSGTWTSLPSEWANVTAEVPTLNGYTAYTGGPASNTNKVPANQFVFPSWNGSDGSTSETDKGSTAYTDAATLYEAKPVHTILYVPEQTEARTVTTKFVYAGGDKDGQKVASDTQIQVYFKRTGTINTATNKVTYGSWTWDKSAGDTDHPGFHIISGNWTISSDGQFSVKAPTVAGYTAAMLNSSGSYGTTNFATPTFNSDTVFTNNTASQWYVRNELTTYYVPNSSVNKTVVRTITITPPNTIAAPTSVTQTATINRLVRVNSDDTGVVYDGFNGSGWSTNTGSWTAYRRIMSYAGYTTVITQVVTNPDGTTTETKLKSIDAQTVDGNTLPTTINVTYTATSTAVLSGEASSTYNGQPISYNDINGGSSDILVQVSGPMAGYYTVGAGDLEFSSDGGKTWSTTLPTNAGTYQLRLTTQGEDAIKAQYGNNSIKWVNEDGTSTIGGSATYIINKTDATATIGGSYERDYDGQPINGTSIYNKITWAGRDTSNNKDFTLNHSITANDYAWYTKSGDQYIKVEGQPVNAGVYYLILNNDYITTLDEANPNYSISKVDGAFVYTINKAQAGSVTFDASVQKTYDGSAILNGASFNTAPSIVIKGADGKPLAGLNNYTFQSGDFEFVDSTGNTISAIIDSNGQIEGPINAGTYTIRLTQAGLNRIEQANPNVNFANVQLADTGSGTLTISQYVPTLNLSGEGSKTYDGQVVTSAELIKQDKDNTITIKLTVPKQGGGTTEVTYAFNPNMDYTGDYDWYSNGTKINAPKNAGTYVIQLKADQVKTILEDLISQDSNYSYLKGNLDLDKLQVAGQASYTINKKPLTVYLDGNSSAVYTGSGAEMPLQDLISHLKANGLVSGETLNTDTFDKADFQWYVKNADGTYSVFTGKDAQGNTVQTPINVGTYYIGILPETSTNSGIDTLRRDNTNYDVTIDYSKYYQFDITPAKGTLTLSGSQTDTYNGQAVSIKDGNYSISFGPVSGNQNSGVLSGDQTAFNAIKWDASDFEFVNGAPTNAGTYQVRLSSAGLQKLQDFANGATGSNYDFSSVVTVDNGKFTASSVTGNYTVNKNELTVSLTNKDGQTPSSVIGKYDLSAGNYTLTITPTETIYGADGKPITLTYDLKDSDLAYKNGTPSNIGTYDVQLTAAAVNDLEQKFGTANYTYKLSPSATHEITKGTGTITLSGGQTETYTGQPAVLNHHKYFVTVATNIYSDSSYLNAGDMQYLVFFTKNADGSYTQLADKPTDVGTYYVGLNDYMVKLLQDATGNNGENYNWSQNYATYVITAAKGTATGSFSNSSSYNAQPIGKQDITVNVTYPGAKSNTYTLQDGDYEYVNKAGSVVTDPTDAGTYTIRLTTAGENHIKQLGNVLDSQGNITKQNVDWTINFTGSYTINAVQMTVTVNGTQNETYDGNAKTINIGRANGVNVTISADGLTVPTIPTTGANALTADDFTIKDAQGNVVTNPTNAGTYKIYLNSKGLAKLGNLSANFIVPESLEQSADLIIARQDVNITEGSTGKTFDAQSAALTDEQFAQYKKAITDAGYNVDGMVSIGGWWFDDTVDYGTQGNPTNPIKDIGTYNLRLNAKGQKELDDANPNYKLKVGDFKYTIYPEVVHIEVDGTQNADWDNQGVSIDPTKFVPKFVVYGGENGDQLITNPVRDDGQPLTLPAGVQLVPGDYEFVDDDGNVIKSFTRQDGTTSANPFKVGSYKVRLTEEGWKKLATQSTDNVKYQYDNSTGTLNINQITPDITLDGANWKTYDGQPVSFDELVSKDPTTNQQLIYVSVTSNGHTIYLPLDPGTYNWSSNGQLLNTAPSQVGTYTITLNKDRVIESLNNWMANNSDYKGSMKILADNIKGSALFEIRARNIADLVADPASGSQTYNGQTAQIDLSAVVGSLKATDSAGKVWKLNTSTLTLDDYTITDPNGNVLTGFPVNVGTYTFKINEKGIAALASANPNFTIPNEINGYSYTYTINQANASGKLDGTNFGTYTGKAITTAQVNSNGRIVVTVDYPGIAISDKTYTLQDGDYTWNTENGSAPTDVGKYTITLTKAGIANVENYILKLAGTGQEGKSNVVFADNAITGSATYTINKAAATISISDSQKQTMPWTGNPAKIDPSNFVPTITSDGQTIAFPSDLNLTSDDYEFVNDKGEVITAPSEIGTYMVRLTGNGWQKVRDAVAGNSNYTWTYEGQGSFEITKAEATVVLSGSSSTVYTGQGAVIPSTDGVVNGITVTVDGKSYNLTPDDLEFVDDQGNVINPVDAGSYKVRLKNDKISSITGLDLTHYNYNYSGNTVQFDITQMPLTITVSDKDNVPTVIYGESTTLNPSDYNIKVTDANGNIMDYTPVAGDLQFKDGVPTSSGTYEVILSDQGLKNIQDKFGTKNYTYTSAGQGSFIVNKATANVKTSGSYEATYDGKTPEIDVAKVINTITTNNGASLTVNNLTADDFEWVDADGNAITSPVNVGTYYLKLKDSSHSKIATNDNYDWSFSGLASVTINKANATIKFSGNDTVTYTGNKVAPTPDAFTVTLADGQTYKLTANDIQVIGDPVNVGTYQVELTQAGIDAINKANPNYNYSYDGSKGTLTIDPAQATATISGLQTSKQPQVDPKNYTVTVNGQTITGLTADDFIFSKDGHPVKLIEAGTYDVELSGDAIDKIRQANPNYNITFSSTAKFTLENSSQTINYVDGSGNVISSTEIGDQLEGTKVSFTPDVPAGWALTDPNNVPSEITISNGTTTIEIKHGTIVVTPDTPEDQIPKGQVPGDPDKQYEELGVLDLKPTRKIIITLPDGTVQEILQQGNLTRTATFDEVTGKITYSDWTAKDGKGAWDEYEPTQIPGYTIHITETVDGKTKDIDSISKVTVSADTQDTTINITYTRDQQPTQPTQPSDSTNPSVPTNPSEPTNPAQPTSPTQPGKPDKPEKPNKNKDDANKQNNKPAKPNKKKKNSKQDKRGQSNNMPKHADMNSRSPKHAATAIANKKGGVNSSKSITAANAKNELPQTGDKQEGIAAWLGLLLSSLGIFNLIGDKKRKKK